MAAPIDPRINSSLSGDRFSAWIALLTLWAVYALVLYKVLPLAGSAEVSYFLAAGAGLVLLFNTAAIIAMVNHLDEDRLNIYGLDLYYRDLMNKKPD